LSILDQFTFGTFPKEAWKAFSVFEFTGLMFSSALKGLLSGEEFSNEGVVSLGFDKVPDCEYTERLPSRNNPAITEHAIDIFFII
jgi:hypothetical protein